MRKSSRGNGHQPLLRKSNRATGALGTRIYGEEQQGQWAPKKNEEEQGSASPWLGIASHIWSLLLKQKHLKLLGNRYDSGKQADDMIGAKGKVRNNWCNKGVPPCNSTALPLNTPPFVPSTAAADTHT
eukprot:100509-Pelagomonas_calceolata.AAC.3